MTTAGQCVYILVCGGIMLHRKVEKIVWIGSWLGTFLFILVFAVIFFVQKFHLQGILCFAVFSTAMISVFFISPWNYPNTYYWKLMLIPYVLLGIGVYLLMKIYGNSIQGNVNWWIYTTFIPVISPIFTIGRRKWENYKTE